MALLSKRTLRGRNCISLTIASALVAVLLITIALVVTSRSLFSSGPLPSTMAEQSALDTLDHLPRRDAPLLSVHYNPTTPKSFIEFKSMLAKRPPRDITTPVALVSSSPPLSVDASPYHAVAGVPSEAIPLLRIPTVFRTAVVRDKPRYCFLVADDKTSGERTAMETANVTQINQILRALTLHSPERVPAVQYCSDDYFKAQQIEMPNAATYEDAFIFDGERCSTNMWHGLLEVVVPIVGAKVLVALGDLGLDVTKLVTDVNVANNLLTQSLARDVAKKMVRDQKGRKHVLFMRSPRKNIWGIHNLGCPILNHYPYGWTTTSVSGWISYSLFDSVEFDAERWPIPKTSNQQRVSRRELTARTGAFDPTNTLFFSETPANKKYEMRIFGKSRSVFIRNRIFYGPSTLCSWDRAFQMPPLSTFPFFEYQNPLCPWTYDVLKIHALSIARIEESPITLQSLRCPKIGVIVRRSFHNGRGMRNFKDFVSKLREHVLLGGPMLNDTDHVFDEGCGTVDIVNLESDVPFGQQMVAINRLDFVVGARGMGLTNAVFMRRHAGLMVISGKEMYAKLNFANDNYPWHPLPSLRPWNPAVLTSCPVVFPTTDFLKKAQVTAAAQFNSTSAQERLVYGKRCVSRSINFCDLHCSVPKLLDDFNRLVFMVRNGLQREGQEDHTTPTPLSSYFHIADAW